jgi:hypothetical protein
MSTLMDMQVVISADLHSSLQPAKFVLNMSISPTYSYAKLSKITYALPG